MWHTIKSIVLHRVGFFDQVNFADNLVERSTNRVDSYHNCVGSEHNWVVFMTESFCRQVKRSTNWVDSYHNWVDSEDHWVYSEDNWVYSEDNWVYSEDNWVDSEDNRVDSEDNRVDFEHNQVVPGDMHNSFLQSTILKQTACHSKTAKVGITLWKWSLVRNVAQQMCL